MLKGSFTVEASVLVPMLLIIYVLIINTGLYMYTEIREQQEQEAQSDIWVIDDFYKYHKLDSGDCRIVLKQISGYVMVKNNGFDILLDGKPEYFD